MRLVVAIFLIATGLLLAAMQIRTLMPGQPRRNSTPGQRRKSWIWFQIGMIDTGNGMLQIFQRPGWDDPLLWALAAYTIAVGLWIFSPNSRFKRQPSATDLDEVNGAAGDARADRARRLAGLRAEGASLGAEKAGLDAEIDRLDEDYKDLNERLKKLRERYKGLNERHHDLGARIERLEQDVLDPD
jgi:cell division protein FtsB